MSNKRKKISGWLVEILLFLLIALFQVWLTCSKCTSLNTYGVVVLFTFLLWFSLWKGNSLLSGLISEKISWMHAPLKRLIIGMVATVGYTVVVVLSLMNLFEMTATISFGRSYVYTFYGSIVITIIISFFMHAWHFLAHWRQAAFEKELYEKQSIAAKYESLKNQVNPHFLFNSLNALTNLVHDDPDKAVHFIQQLSAVYRYVLDTRDLEIVPLSRELTFLNAYADLQRIRFGEKLIIDLNLQPAPDVQVAPLALQMLLENAIKHNIVSEEDPLTIRLYTDDGFLVVENNLQRKDTGNESLSGVGLDNICKRYEFLSDRKVEVSDTGTRFIVKLPIINKIIP